MGTTRAACKLERMGLPSLRMALQIRRVTESTGCGMATLGTWLPRRPKGHHGIRVLTSSPTKDK
jgi:hypothetical protein